MSWSEMNCPRNTEVIPGKQFLLTDKSPQDPVTLPNCVCRVYHPTVMPDSGQAATPLCSKTMTQIESFIQRNNVTETGNVTQLPIEVMRRMLKTPLFVAVVEYKGLLVGTMWTFILRCCSKDGEILSTYTTFLCVDKVLRKQGLAMLMIRFVMKEGYARYGINHGYYMTENTHHEYSSRLPSWYRPLNLSKAKSAGFDIPSRANAHDRDGLRRQRMAYHIARPKILPRVASEDDYELAIQLLKSGDFWWNPTVKEWTMMCQCFDIYLVSDYGLFMLFPMLLTVADTGQVAKLAELSLMIGNITSQVLWQAKDNYAVLYGWSVGDITIERIQAMKGIHAAGNVHIEWYNSLPPAQIRVPLF